MSPAQSTTVMVFVERDWYDDTLRILLKKPRSNSSTGFHALVGELRDDTNNPAGIWFKNVPKPQDVAERSTTMEFLVPWRVIVGVALVNQIDPRKIGFADDPGACTVLVE